MVERMLNLGSMAGRRIAVSVSTSPDIDRLGLTERHVQLALAELARAVFTSGGTLVYGGHLKPGGYTPLLIEEFERWHVSGPERTDGKRREGAGLTLCLAWSVHRATALSRIEEVRDMLGVAGKLIAFDLDGKVVDPAEGRGEQPPQPPPDQYQERRALRTMRQWMTANSDARVVVGGARWHPDGRVPGIAEEALLALEARQPVYLAGGFGGAAHDVVQALGVGHEDWGAAAPEGLPAAVAGLEEALANLRAMRENSGWAGLRNGLTDQENQRLATSPRASEIAMLVHRGLAETWSA
jgi:hypothetical protein